MSRSNESRSKFRSSLGPGWNGRMGTKFGSFSASNPKPSTVCPARKVSNPKPSTVCVGTKVSNPRASTLGGKGGGMLDISVSSQDKPGADRRHRHRRWERVPDSVADGSEWSPIDRKLDLPDLIPEGAVHRLDAARRRDVGFSECQEKSFRRDDLRGWQRLGSRRERAPGPPRLPLD